jgi:hypothetical protein
MHSTSQWGWPNSPLLNCPHTLLCFAIAAVDQSTLVLQATGKKKLIVAGIVTDVCVSFVSLSALEEDFEVRPATSPHRFVSNSPLHHALNENELQCFISHIKSEAAQKVH